MESRYWRVLVTDLGATTPIVEVTVEAGNWMSALKTGRAQLGEQAVVPQGASCSVARDGSATVHDPMGRRTYLVQPLQNAGEMVSYKPSQPSGPRIPADSVPRKSTGESTRVDKDKRKALKQTIGYNASELRASMRPEIAVGRERESSHPPTAVGKRSARLEIPNERTSGRPERTSGRPEKISARPEKISARPDIVANKPSAAPSVSQSSSSARGSISAKSQPGAKAPQGLFSSGSRQAVKVENLSLLISRDEDPSPNNPLLYRERVYVVPENTTTDVAEVLLRQQFEDLRKSMEQQRPGKFFNFAVFDHRFQDRPRKPPLVTLKWKDWRGDPEIEYPSQARKSRTSFAEPSQPEAIKNKPTTETAAMQRKGATPVPSDKVILDPALTGAPDNIIVAPELALSVQPTVSATSPLRKRSTTDEHDAHLAHAFEACQDLLFLTTPAEGLEFVMKLLDEVLPTEAASACLYDINTDEFRFVAVRGPGAEQRKGEAVSSKVGLMGAAANLLDRPLKVEVLLLDDRFDASADARIGLELRNGLYMSVSHQGRLLGMLQLLNRTRLPQFTNGDCNLIAYVAGQLGAFLNESRGATQGLGL